MRNADLRKRKMTQRIKLTRKFKTLPSLAEQSNCLYKTLINQLVVIFGVLLGLTACSDAKTDKIPDNINTQPDTINTQVSIPTRLSTIVSKEFTDVCNDILPDVDTSQLLSKNDRIATVEILAKVAVCADMYGNSRVAGRLAFEAVMLSENGNYDGEWYILSLALLASQISRDDPLMYSWASKRLSAFETDDLNYDWAVKARLHKDLSSARHIMFEMGYTKRLYENGLNYDR